MWRFGGIPPSLVSPQLTLACTKLTYESDFCLHTRATSEARCFGTVVSHYQRLIVDLRSLSHSPSHLFSDIMCFH